MIFKNKKAELVKEKALVEIEEFSKKMLDRMNFSFDVMNERNNLKKTVTEKDSLIADLKKQVSEKQDKITSLNLELMRANKKEDKLYECLEKIAVAIKDYNQKLYDEIQDLKSDRYLIVSEKPTKETKQKMGIKSGTKTSKIIKAVKEG